ncbi:MAG: type III pantothenate kinase [Candidatus Omnitrophota bacterium]
MILAIDMGNTNITFGLFRGSRLVKSTRLSTAAVKSYNSFVQKASKGIDVRAVAICSVVPKVTRALMPLLKRHFNSNVFILGKDIKVPIKNLYKNPRQVGQDRLVAAYAAHALYAHSSPVVVIDFGTAVTFDVVSKKGAYLGGLIVPGMEMSLEALSKKAALLPKVRLEKPSFILGKTTKDSMISGVFYGYAAMCDGLVARLKKRFGRKFYVVATGGNARRISPLSSSIDKVDEDLVLKGVNLAFLRGDRRQFSRNQ